MAAVPGLAKKILLTEQGLDAAGTLTQLIKSLPTPPSRSTSISNGRSR
ncbi:MAG: hypothetical protein WAU59_16065 [Rhodoplanes sp.]|jgi:hypothetical protein